MSLKQPRLAGGQAAQRLGGLASTLPIFVHVSLLFHLAMLL